MASNLKTRRPKISPSATKEKPKSKRKKKQVQSLHFDLHKPIKRPLGSRWEELFLTILEDQCPTIPKPLSNWPVPPYSPESAAWRADFAWPDSVFLGTYDSMPLSGGIVVEIEGAVFSNGRHVRGVGYSNDAMKYNHLTALGFEVYRFTSVHLANSTIDGTIAFVSDAFDRRRQFVRSIRADMTHFYATLKSDRFKMEMK